MKAIVIQLAMELNMSKLNVAKSTWIFCLVLAVLGLVSIWFFKSYTKVAYERNIGYSNEAKRNPFLALEKFVQAYEVNYESRKDFNLFKEEVGQYDTVLINNSRIAMSETIRKEMNSWVSKGGHLVLLATEYYNQDLDESRDKFLDELGLRLYESEINDYDVDDEDLISEMTFEGDTQPTQVNFGSYYGYLHDSSEKASYIGGNNFADYMIQYPIEKGLVTVLTDFSVWNNNNIQNYDNALFFMQLIGSTEKTWFIYNRNQPSLIALGFDKIPYVIISVLVLLVLVLFSHFWRQGVLHQDDRPVSREILQHITAAARFKYRLNRGSLLIKTMRKALLQKANRSIVGFSRLTDDEQLEKLEEVSKISRNKLMLIWQDNNESNDEFIDKIKLMQKIRKNL